MSNEGMTETQASYLALLCTEAGEHFEVGLSKAEAAQRIAALERKLGRRPAPPLTGGDGGASIRANEAPSPDQPQLE